MDTAKGVVSLLKEIDAVVDIVHKPTKKDPTLFKYILFCEDFTSEAYIPRESTLSLKGLIKQMLDENAIGNPGEHDTFEEYMNSVGEFSRLLDTLETWVKKAQKYNWIRTPEDFAQAKEGGVILDKVK